MAFDKFYEAQDILVDILRRDLIGPVREDEVLEEAPSRYYLLGKLYPQQAGEALLEGDEETARDDEEEIASLGNTTAHAAEGLTFLLKRDAGALAFDVSFACYVPEVVKAASEEADTPEQRRWHRKAVQQRITFAPDTLAAHQRQRFDLSEGAELCVYCNQELSDGRKIVTASLVNTHVMPRRDWNIDPLILFQVMLRVAGQDAGAPFANLQQHWDVRRDEELLTLDMLYHRKQVYAQGHGCSAVWDMEHKEPAWVGIEDLPSHALLQMRPATPSFTFFSLERLAHADAGVLDEMESFCASYEAWIASQAQTLHTYPEAFHAVGEKNLARCRATLARMRETIAALRAASKTDAPEWRAFRFTNEAMLMQRVQVLKTRGKNVDTSAIAWYPFQFAFFLCEIESFIHPEGDGRKTVDLLWFPTGGGKTEAYLGIAAYAIFLRRLRDADADGVTVIMRYTLRMLTIQQFERASVMIAACEIIRQRERLDGEEISIGMWVGDKMVPNKLETAAEFFANGGSRHQEDRNPMQVHRCPWCGHALTAADYHVYAETQRMEIHCPNEACAMHALPHGLPIHLIDEDIYAWTPTFLVATVDKFAQLPFQDRTFSLFGNLPDGTRKQPPELIVQDELHLLTGPLGTVTGIYEALVTEFCRRGDVPVKIIASTATIRNAAAQIRALYGRAHTQFPPQGITMEDSFFAVESGRDERPARRYLGVMGVGTTHTTTFIRVNAALLYATRYLAEAGSPEAVVDHFWTLVDYFNTLRELGSARNQVHDEVQSRYGYLKATKLRTLYPLKSAMADKKHDLCMELDSLVSNTELTRNLHRLERPYREAQPMDALTFVLASNIISVGIDIQRLGLMTVFGQPKTNAEYIQATSRIGRQEPGLVVTLYNPARSRDRSHYEQFLRYHQALYRFVEASSLTPFSARAMDRGLAALLVAACRFFVPELREDGAAMRFQRTLAGVQETVERLLAVTRRVEPAAAPEVQGRLEELMALWEQAASEGELHYHSYQRNHRNLIAKDTELEQPFHMMNSMRNVEPSCAVYLVQTKGERL